MNTKDATVGGRTPESASSRTYWKELLSGVLYKRTQGKMARQLTCLAIWIFMAAAAWRFHQIYLTRFFQNQQLVGYLVALALGLAGMWAAYRLVNWPKFADFLISVEAELNKVSWPSWKELVRASLVVIFTIIFLALLLFLYDAIWRYLFELAGIE